jgi:hypothetical protein
MPLGILDLIASEERVLPLKEGATYVVGYRWDDHRAGVGLACLSSE